MHLTLIYGAGSPGDCAQSSSSFPSVVPPLQGRLRTRRGVGCHPRTCRWLHNQYQYPIQTTREQKKDCQTSFGKNVPSSVTKRKMAARKMVYKEVCVPNLVSVECEGD